MHFTEKHDWIYKTPWSHLSMFKLKRLSRTHISQVPFVALGSYVSYSKWRPSRALGIAPTHVEQAGSLPKMAAPPTLLSLEITTKQQIITPNTPHSPQSRATAHSTMASVGECSCDLPWIALNILEKKKKKLDSLSKLYNPLKKKHKNNTF